MNENTSNLRNIQIITINIYVFNKHVLVSAMFGTLPVANSRAFALELGKNIECNDITE